MRIVVPQDINNAILTTTDVTEADYAAYSAVTTYSTGDRVIWVDPSSTVTITIASPGVITWAAHGLANGQVVIFTTTDTLPTGITAGIAYYVVTRATDTFQIATIKGGAPIVTTGSQAGTHTATADVHLVFESLGDSNLGNTPPNPGFTSTKWVKVSSTNRWKMFDEAVSSRTSNLDTIDVTVDVVGRVTAVACLNMSAQSVQVIVTDSVEGEVYNTTKNLVSSLGINSWHAYYFTERTRTRDFLFDDLPSYLNSQIQVIITDTGDMAEIGSLVFGKIMDYGATQYGMSLGIIDFSAKNTDTFGNTTITKRGFKKTMNLDSIVENNQIDEIFNTLSDLRATAVVYEGSSSFSSSLVMGYFQDFDVVIPRPTSSTVTIEIEGLT